MGEVKAAAEEERVEKYFQKMLKDQENTVLAEVQTARLNDPSFLGVEEQVKLWKQNREYESCLKRRANLQFHDVLRRAVVIAQGKNEIRLTCPAYCQNPLSPKIAKWVYSAQGEFMAKKRSVVLEETDYLISDEGDLIIGNIELKDAGLYSCHDEGQVVVTWLVEVIPKEQFVTISGSSPPLNTRREYEQLNLVAEIQMTPWSPCSHCHHIGTRYRFGTCVLKVGGKWPNHVNVTLRNPLRMLDIYHETGVPCRSAYMAAIVKEVPDIRRLTDFIQHDHCRVPCSSSELVFFKQEMKAHYSKIPMSSALKGEMVLKGFTTSQKFVEKVWFPGNDIFLTCPGINSRDSVTWTKGQIPLETIIRETSNFDDRIVILQDGQVMVRRPTEKDMGIYVCYKWGQQDPTAAVKVKTHKVSRAIKEDRLEYTKEVLMLVPLLMMLMTVLLVTWCTGRHHEE